MTVPETCIFPNQVNQFGAGITVFPFVGTVTVTVMGSKIAAFAASIF